MTPDERADELLLAGCVTIRAAWQGSLMAVVEDSGTPFVVRWSDGVRRHGRGRSAGWHCKCPTGPDCVHVLAVQTVADDSVQGEQPAVRS